MTNRFATTAAALALAAFSTFAQAQDEPIETEPPGRVGRVSLAQGQVSISGDVGETGQDAVVNWPVTSRNTITTAPGARTEVRIGSTSVRLDGDSALEVTELDDDSLRLRLHYGSASIRVASSEVAPEFELTTPQARVRLREPGRLRVDAERVRDTSLVSVFDGEAQVDGAGASLTIRAGRSAEIRDDDVRTQQARRDAFDDWALARDRQEDSSRAARYVGTEMTGYEELDRYGRWTSSDEYGSLWIPTVATGWAPYRDGRWTWIAPWGWTWVDNAPWGYAPFHYGRWVHLNKRWAWAPGRHHRRPVWAPALVGWVGGSGWNVHFHSRSMPAHGWYPLGPHERYVPGYWLSDERLRRLHNYGWRDRKDRRDRDRDGRPDYRREGLTVVPQAQFAKPGPVMVTNVPRVDSAPLAVPGPASAPPPPSGWRGRERPRPILGDRLDRIDRGDRNQANPAVAEREREDRERDRERWNRRERDDGDRWGRRDRDDAERQRFNREQRPPVLTTHPNPLAPNVQQPNPLAPNLEQPPRQQWQRPERERDRERAFEERRQRPQPIVTMPAPVVHAAPPVPRPAPMPQAAPAPQPMMPPPQALAPPPRANPVAPPAQQAAPAARFKAEQRALNDNQGVREQER